MVRFSALVMAVVMLAVAVGTYFALSLVPPGLIPGIGSVTEHLGASTPAAAAPAPQAAPPTPVAAAESEPNETPEDLEAAPAETVAEAAPAPGSTTIASHGTGAADYGSSEEIERALANEPPPEGGSVDAGVRPVTPAPAKPAAQPAPAKATEAPASQAPVASPKAAPKPAPETAAPAPAPKPQPKVATSPEPKAAPTSTAEPAEAAKAPAASKASTAASADALKQWWPDPSTMPTNQLKLVYAGQVRGQDAIALLFSDALNLESLKPNVQVTADDGSLAAGEWTIGKNPKLAIISGLAPGRYTVVLKPAVAGQSGFMLGTTLQGPVYVQAP